MNKVVFGEEELIAALQNLKGGVSAGLGKSVLAGAKVLEGIVKQSMNEAHHGRTYRRGGRIHQASAPGEPPAIDFGYLINSINSELVESTPEIAVAQVATNSEAAQPLEFGTATVAARPFMRPGVDEHEEEINGAVGATLTRLIKEAIRK